jgi:hypothetical protein
MTIFYFVTLNCGFNPEGINAVTPKLWQYQHLAYVPNASTNRTASKIYISHCLTHRFVFRFERRTTQYHMDCSINLKCFRSFAAATWLATYSWRRFHYAGLELPSWKNSWWVLWEKTWIVEVSRLWLLVHHGSLRSNSLHFDWVSLIRILVVADGAAEPANLASLLILFSSQIWKTSPLFGVPSKKQ